MENQTELWPWNEFPEDSSTWQECVKQFQSKHASVNALVEALEQIIVHQHPKYERCAVVNGFASGGGDINCARALARNALAALASATQEEK